MARYEFLATIQNNSGERLEYSHYCKGKDDNPSGYDTTKGHLYHGEMLDVPSTIDHGGSTTFRAKSVGSTIQGTVVMKTASGRTVWIYFHVPDISSRHSQSGWVDGSIGDSGKHATASYTVNPVPTQAATVYRIRNLVDTFKAVKDGDDSSHKARKFNLTVYNRAPGSGVSADLIAHQQGMCRIDGANNFFVCGSAKGNPGYFYYILNGVGFTGNGGRDDWSIDDVMTHPGGLQAAENILATGNEQYSGASTRGDRSNIRFFEISCPTAVEELEHLKIERRGDGKIASAVALTKRGEQWILAVRGKSSIDFYAMSGDPRDRTCQFTELSGCISGDLFKEFQNMQLYLDEHNALFLFGLPDKTTNEDMCRLYSIQVTCDDNDQVEKITGATEEASTHFHRNGSGPRFKWAGCVAFDPDTTGASGDVVSGQFRVYSAAGHVVDEKIKCNEWNKDL